MSAARLTSAYRDDWKKRVDRTKEDTAVLKAEIQEALSKGESVDAFHSRKLKLSASVTKLEVCLANLTDYITNYERSKTVSICFMYEDTVLGMYNLPTN